MQQSLRALCGGHGDAPQHSLQPTSPCKAGGNSRISCWPRAMALCRTPRHNAGTLPTPQCHRRRLACQVAAVATRKSSRSRSTWPPTAARWARGCRIAGSAPSSTGVSMMAAVDEVTAPVIRQPRAQRASTGGPCGARPRILMRGHGRCLTCELPSMASRGGRRASIAARNSSKRLRPQPARDARITPGLAGADGRGRCWGASPCPLQRARGDCCIVLLGWSGRFPATCKCRYHCGFPNHIIGATRRRLFGAREMGPDRAVKW